MPFLTLNGITVPVRSGKCEEALVEYGDRTPAYSGAARKNIRATKRQWSCTTKGLSFGDYEALQSLILGRGFVLPFDGNPVSNGGLMPSAFSATAPVYSHALSTYDNAPRQIQKYTVAALPPTVVTGSASKFSPGAAAWFGPATTNFYDESDPWVDETPTLVSHSSPATGVYSLVRNATAGQGIWISNVFHSMPGGFSTGDAVRISLDIMKTAGTPNVKSQILWFTSGGSLVQTDNLATATHAPTLNGWTRLVGGSVIPATATKIKIRLYTDGDVSYTILVRRMQAEVKPSATEYAPFATPRTAASYVQYNLDRYRLGQTGFTVLCWTPYPDLLAPVRTGLWCMGETDALDSGTSGQNRVGIQFEQGANNARFQIKGVATDIAIDRQLMTWRLVGYRHVPGTANPHHLIVNGAVASQVATSTLDASKLKRLYVSGTSVASGVVAEPAWTYIDDFAFFPYAISDAHLAQIAAGTVALSSPAYPEMSGDIVGNVSGLRVLGRVDSGDFLPRNMSGTWRNNAREMRFTLVEA